MTTLPERIWRTDPGLSSGLVSTKIEYVRADVAAREAYVPEVILRARDETIAEASAMTGPTDRPLAGWFGLSLDDLRAWAAK